MGKSSSAKGGFGAVFAKDAEFLYYNGQRKIRKARLIARSGCAPRVVEDWAVPITHSSTLTLSADENVLIVTDTAGGHYGLLAETGEILWRSVAIGEGDAGIILPDESFLFASWEGALQRIDPTDGKAVVKPLRHDHQIRKLQFAPALACAFYRRILPADSERSRPSQSLWRLDVDTLEGREILPLSECNDIAVDPTGKFAVMVDDLLFGARPPSMSLLEYLLSEKNTQFDVCIHDLATQKVVQSRRFHFSDLTFTKLRWSPGGRIICFASGKGFGFLRRGDLEPFAFVPARFSSDVTFSADGTLMFLTAWETSTLLRVADLVDYPFSAAPHLAPLQ